MSFLQTKSPPGLTNAVKCTSLQSCECSPSCFCIIGTVQR